MHTRRMRLPEVELLSEIKINFQIDQMLAHEPLFHEFNLLSELSVMYALFAPIQAAYKESQSLTQPAI